MLTIFFCQTMEVF